jgi:hypothetical protein
VDTVTDFGGVTCESAATMVGLGQVDVDSEQWQACSEQCVMTLQQWALAAGGLVSERVGTVLVGVRVEFKT